MFSFEALELSRARNRDDPGSLCEEPRERDLRGRGVLPLGDALQQVDRRLSRHTELCAAPRADSMEAGLVPAGGWDIYRAGVLSNILNRRRRYSSLRSCPKLHFFPRCRRATHADHSNRIDLPN